MRGFILALVAFATLALALPRVADDQAPKKGGISFRVKAWRLKHGINLPFSRNLPPNIKGTTWLTPSEHPGEIDVDKIEDVRRCYFALLAYGLHEKNDGLAYDKVVNRVMLKAKGYHLMKWNEEPDSQESSGSKTEKGAMPVNTAEELAEWYKKDYHNAYISKRLAEKTVKYLKDLGDLLQGVDLKEDFVDIWPH